MSERMSKVVLGGFLAASLSACVTLGPQEVESTGAGMATVVDMESGAVLGVATAADRWERKRQSLSSAGWPAVPADGVADYMDRLEAQLREQQRDTGVEMSREGDYIRLVVSDKASQEVLSDVARVLNAHDRTIVEVAGHTDNTGGAGANQRLSEHRARAVAARLLDAGILEDRMLVVGFGEDAPVADNDSAAGRRQNARVELTLVPVTPSKPH